MVLSEAVTRFLRAAGPEHTPLQARMAEKAEDLDFPIIGPDAGGVLRLLARLTDAEEVFEFGSGFGYSATWFLRGGADRVVLTEFDEEELDLGREYLTDAGLAARARFEYGDAMETVGRYDGPFDIVLIDHQKSRYEDAFNRAKPRLRPGGVVVADNIMRGPIDFDRVLDYLEGKTTSPADDESTAGIARYVATVRDNPDMETVALPVGSGLAVSFKQG